MYWWNEDIADLRKECISRRRGYERAGSRGGDADRLVEHTQYAETRKKLRNAIRESQCSAWKQLTDSVESDP